MDGVLPTYLATNGSAAGLVGIDPDGLTQALEAGMAQGFPALAHVPKIDFRSGPEQILLSRPAAVFMSRAAGASLTNLGFRGVCSFQDTRTSTLAMWNLIGRLTQNDARVRQILEREQAKEQQVETAVASHQRVSAVILSAGAGYWYIAGRTFYLRDVLELAGGRNAVKSYGAYPEVDLEQLAVLDPEVIFLSAQPWDAVIPTDLYQRPEWGVLRAVRAGRVYKMPRFAAFMGPIERPLVAQWLAELLHEDLGAQFRTDFKDAYRSGYGYEVKEADIDHAIFTRENSGSRGYQRFAAPRTSDAVPIQTHE